MLVCLQVVVIGDGQVSMGNMVVKPNARKVRRIGDSVVVGFAGAWEGGNTADKPAELGSICPNKKHINSSHTEECGPAFFHTP